MNRRQSQKVIARYCDGGHNYRTTTLDRAYNRSFIGLQLWLRIGDREPYKGCGQ